MSPKEFERRSLLLSPAEWADLERLAAELNCLAPTGPTAGQPSWRSLIKEIAWGALQVTRPDEEEQDA